jgi:hypothetical protein
LTWYCHITSRTSPTARRRHAQKYCIWKLLLGRCGGKITTQYFSREPFVDLLGDLKTRDHSSNVRALFPSTCTTNSLRRHAHTGCIWELLMGRCGGKITSQYFSREPLVDLLGDLRARVDTSNVLALFPSTCTTNSLKTSCAHRPSMGAVNGAMRR